MKYQMKNLKIFLNGNEKDLNFRFHIIYWENPNSSNHNINLPLVVKVFSMFLMHETDHQYEAITEQLLYGTFF